MNCDSFYRGRPGLEGNQNNLIISDAWRQSREFYNHLAKLLDLRIAGQNQTGVRQSLSPRRRAVVSAGLSTGWGLRLGPGRAAHSASIDATCGPARWNHGTV